MLDIGKIRGALLSALIICFYYFFWLPYWHAEWFGFPAQSGWGTRLILIGLIMTQVVVIQPGDTAHLTFLGGLLNRTWNGGIALLPNVFHTTIVMFRFSVLWGLAVLRNTKFERYEEPDIRINTSDANFKYQANVQMEYAQAQVSRFTEVVMRIFLDYKRVPEEYYVASFGYRVLVVGIVMVCINSTSVVANKKLHEVATSASQTLGLPAPPLPPKNLKQGPTQKAPTVGVQEDRQKLTVLSYLEEGQKPVIPPERDFVSLPAGDKIFYTEYEGDERKYMLFHEPPLGEVTSLAVKESLCAIVPSGRKIRFYTKYPPTYAVNMNPRVTYQKKESVLNKHEREYLEEKEKNFPEGKWVMIETVPWRTLYKKWTTEVSVERGSYIEARGGEGEHITTRIPGGIVCF